MHGGTARLLGRRDSHLNKEGPPSLPCSGPSPSPGLKTAPLCTSLLLAFSALGGPSISLLVRGAAEAHQRLPEPKVDFLGGSGPAPVVSSEPTSMAGGGLMTHSEGRGPGSLTKGWVGGGQVGGVGVDSWTGQDRTAVLVG